jgi:hypothetical protein
MRTAATRLAAPVRAAALLAVAGAAGFLLARVAPDVTGKPLFEDEAVAGLIGARPPGEILVTALWDRGGAPLHYLLVRLAFVFDASPDALRWLSVVLALAAVAVCYDLGRRLAGAVAGVAAATVAACSGMLAVYASFGRMYALFAFAAALAADLFVRALDKRTTSAAAWAAAAAWLLPATHNYGGIVVVVEALVALALWRGRPLRAGLPVIAIAVATTPFLVADLRLANRFDVSSEASGRLATREEAWNQAVSALRGFAGGEGALFVIFLVLAGAGVLLTLRRRAAFVFWALVAFALPPLLSVAVRTGRAPDLSPRHLVFALPFFAAFVGVTVARVPRLAVLPALAAVAALAAVSPPGIHDPRSITYTAALGSESAVAAPAHYLRARVGERDVLYPYSSVFLAALPEAGRAHGLPRAQTQSLLAALGRLDYPVRQIFVAVPRGTADFGSVEVVGQAPFESWLLVRRVGPFGDEAAVLEAIRTPLAELRAAAVEPLPAPLAAWFDLNESVLCKSLSETGAGCGTQ